MAHIKRLSNIQLYQCDILQNAAAATTTAASAGASNNPTATPSPESAPAAAAPATSSILDKVQYIDASDFAAFQGRCDVVFSLGILHTMPDPGLAVARMRQMLKLGGQLAVVEIVDKDTDHLTAPRPGDLEAAAKHTKRLVRHHSYFGM